MLLYILDNRGCHVAEMLYVFIYQSLCLHVGQRKVYREGCNHIDKDKTVKLLVTVSLSCWIASVPALIMAAAAASLTIEGQHSVMSRITKGDWQE